MEIKEVAYTAAMELAGTLKKSINVRWIDWLRPSVRRSGFLSQARAARY